VNVHLPGVNLNSIVTFVFLFNLQGGFVQSVILKLSENGCGPPETKNTQELYCDHIFVPFNKPKRAALLQE